MALVLRLNAVLQIGYGLQIYGFLPDNITKVLYI